MASNSNYDGLACLFVLEVLPYFLSCINSIESRHAEVREDQVILEAEAMHLLQVL